MKIAQIAPLCESVPPRLYGGTERVVSWLTEELAARGHDVALFASGDSLTSAELVPVTQHALRLDPSVRDMMPYHVMMLDQLRRRAHEFDIIHFHIDIIHAPLAQWLDVPTLTTLHGRQDLPDLIPFYRAFPNLPVVSISDSQRAPLPRANWIATVLHGLPADMLPACLNPPGDYLAFLGRISPEKRPDRAIEIAAAAGMKLKIAAKVDNADKDYWSRTIAPLAARHGDIVEFVGEIGDRQKAEFLGNARALLFPIDWPEPFGLVMIEAMACGTPVIAFRCGSVSEVIDHGVSGFIVETVPEAVEAVLLAPHLSRAEVRARFESRFSVARMADDYLELYRRLIDEASAPRAHVVALRNGGMGIEPAAA